LDRVIFSSERDDWETPTDLFNELNKEFLFDLDATANKNNAKCPKFFTKEQNALVQEWRGSVFCNPPYGREIQKFIEKAYIESKKAYCKRVVLLIPARTDTKIWHDFIFPFSREIIFIKGRLKYELNKISNSPAPFPSAIIIFEECNL
jgi:phage N-6-adenine-methyltransferase